MPSTTPDLKTAPELKLWRVPPYGVVSLNLARMLTRIARQAHGNRSHAPQSAKKGVVRNRV